MVDPLMLENFVHSGSLAWVVIEDLCDDVTGGVGDGHLVREIIGVHTDALVGCLHIGRLEGRFADNQRVDYDTNRPDVDFIRVALLSFKNFWSDVVWCTTDCPFALAIELKLRRKTEVTNFHFHLVIEEQVSQLKISVDNTMRMEVLDSRADLGDIALDLKLMQPLAPPKEFVQTLILAQLE